MQNDNQNDQVVSNVSEQNETLRNVTSSPDRFELSTADSVEKLSKPFYSSSEMVSLDWQKIDTSRIPPEMQPFYKSMQASYTKKRQAETENLRKLAANAPAEPVQAAAPFSERLNEFQAAVSQAREIVSASVPNYNEADPAISMTVNALASEIAENSRHARENANLYRTKYNEAQIKYGADFKAVDNLALKILEDEYPSSLFKQVNDAAKRGNFAPIERVLDEAYNRIKNGHVSAEAAASEARKKTPPCSLAAGNRSGSTRDETAKLFGF